MYVDGALEKSWVFQEAMLDSTHCVAVALHQVCLLSMHTSVIFSKMFTMTANQQLKLAGNVEHQVWHLSTSQQFVVFKIIILFCYEKSVQVVLERCIKAPVTY